MSLFALFIFLNVLRARLMFPCVFVCPQRCGLHVNKIINTLCKYHQELFWDFCRSSGCGWMVAGVTGACLNFSLTSHVNHKCHSLSVFCLRRCFVSPGPFQSLHREPADVCGQQGGCLCPAGAEDAGTVPAGYLCGQHLWTQWVHEVQNSMCGPGSMLYVQIFLTLRV